MGKHNILSISSFKGLVTGASEPKNNRLWPTVFIKLNIAYGMEQEVSKNMFLYCFRVKPKSIANSIANPACPRIIGKSGKLVASFAISLLLIPPNAENLGVK